MRPRLAIATALLPFLGAAACGGGPSGASGSLPAQATARYASDGVPEDPATKAARRQSVLFICLDTVRADAFGPWASGAPLLAETSAWLRAHGVAFRQACATAPWTAPSVASLMTGLLPSGHGVRELGQDQPMTSVVPTMAEILRAQGWRAVSYVAGGWVSGDTGLLQGFETTTAPFSFGGMRAKLLATQVKTRAFFPKVLFLHTLEAHDPYDAPAAKPGVPPEPPPVDLAAIDREAAADGGRSLARRFLLDWKTRPAVFDDAQGRARLAAVTRYFERGFRDDPQGPALAAEAKAAYGRGLARLDAELSAYLRGLESEGLLESTILVLCADHGEGFGEHGTVHHGRRLYDELLHVPLYLAAPGLPAGAEVDGSVSLADVLPTVLDLMGLPAPEGIEGRSLLPVAHGGPGRPVLAEERRTASETGLPGDERLVSVRDGRWKWIQTRDLAAGTAKEEVYDLAADPGETKPLGVGSAPTWSSAFADAVRRARALR